MHATPNSPMPRFIEHAEELRRRVLFGLIGVVLGAVAGWMLYPWVYRVLAGPFVASVRAHGGILITQHPMDALLLRLQVAGAMGLVFGFPVLCWQVWAFVRPALTPRERRVAAPLLPAACALFLAGAGVAYLFLPVMMAFFLAFIPPDVSAYIDFKWSVDLPLKLLFGFGIVFQLPVVVLALVAMRLVTPALLWRHWRVAVLVIALLAAIITPTIDPASMALVMAPLLVLYIITALLAGRIAGQAEV